MIQKPKIQYIGQFYVHGSEARAIEQQDNRPKFPALRKPLEKLEKIEKVYVDPVALIAIGVAVFMLAAMLLGIGQLQDDWAEYQEMSDRVHTLRERNHTKTEELRKLYTLSDIRVKASAMGMIPRADAEHMTVTVTRPEPEPEMTWMDHVQWFLKGLFA